MIGSVGNQALAAQSAEARVAGKNAQAVGQQAKAIVAIARELGADMPKNAQGLAASTVARGIDPASLFAARVAEPESAGDTVAPGVAPVAVEPVAEVAADGVESGDGATSAVGEADAVSGVVDAAKQLIVSEDPGLALLIDETTSRDAG